MDGVWDFAGMFAEHPAIWLATAAVLGACMASFGGVVVDRLPHSAGWRGAPDPDVSLLTPSRCLCGRRVGALALVPVLGWLLMRGRCRGCGSRVPALYPLVEACTAVASALVAWRFGPGEAGCWALVALWSCLVLAWIDWNEAWLPDRITVPLLVAGLLGSPFVPDALTRNTGMAACLGVFALSFGLLGWIKGMSLMATGDLMLAAAAGAWLGGDRWLGFVLCSAGVYAAGHAAMRLAGRRWEPRDPAMRAHLGGGAILPMGPALCLSFMACLLVS